LYPNLWLMKSIAYWVRGFYSNHSLTSPFVHLILPDDIVALSLLSFCAS
jgi:hypothetical protein